MKRKSTGKRLRFKVFERDGFTCQYCGKKPPEVILHIDHIIPVYKGGQTEIENLITACAECNLGKATTILGHSIPRTEKNAEELQEKYDQLKAFYKLQKEYQNVREEAVNEIVDYWEDLFDGENVTTLGRLSFKNLLNKFSPSDIKEAIEITIARIGRKDRESRFRYMCGVLHTKRKQSQT